MNVFSLYLYRLISNYNVSYNACIDMGTFEGMIYLQSTKHMSLIIFLETFIYTITIIYTFWIMVKSFTILKISNNDCIKLYINGIHM